MGHNQENLLRMKKTPRIAIVADWLTVSGGAEVVIKRMLQIFPSAHLFTTVHSESGCRLRLPPDRVHTSYLQRLPHWLRKRHPFLLPWLPGAIESLDVSEFDIVISSSSFVGKGVLTHPAQLHICYCHTPTRYLWGEWQQYLKDFPIPKPLKWLLPRYFTGLRQWDLYAAKRPDLLIANSDYIGQSIAKFYHRESEVICPPADIKRFREGLKAKKESYYLGFGRLVPQKRFDLLIETFKKMPHQRLVIAGTGRNEKELKKLAGGAQNIEFRGYVKDRDIPALLGKARALLFPQLEDAGITAIEALAAGTPVISYGKGGVTSTLAHGKTGVFFDEQTPFVLERAIHEFEAIEKTFDRQNLSKYAEKYGIERFDEELKALVEKEWKRFCVSPSHDKGELEGV